MFLLGPSAAAQMLAEWAGPHAPADLIIADSASSTGTRSTAHPNHNSGIAT
jgi:hypothetical protein